MRSHNNGRDNSLLQSNRPPNKPNCAVIGPACRSSVLFFGLIFLPESRLNCSSTLVSEVGEYSGPVKDAALCPCQSLLHFLELAFGVAHSTAPDSVEL